MRVHIGDTRGLNGKFNVYHRCYKWHGTFILNLTALLGFLYK